MNINYQLNSDELDDAFLESIKQLFKGREINIFISEITDMEYLSKIPNMIASIQEGIKEDIKDCASLKDIDWE